MKISIKRSDLRTRTSTFVVAVGALVLGFGFSSGSVVGTDAPSINICHATSDPQNPFQMIEVNASSVDEYNNLDANGHGDHDGPMYPEDKWGDIIPPFENDHGTFPGLNWPAGQSIWNNDCSLPGATTTQATTTEPSTSIATSTSAVSQLPSPGSTTTETPTSVAGQASATTTPSSVSQMPVTGVGSNLRLALLGALMMLLGGVMMVGTRRPLSVD